MAAAAVVEVAAALGVLAAVQLRNGRGILEHGDCGGLGQDCEIVDSLY